MRSRGGRSISAGERLLDLLACEYPQYEVRYAITDQKSDSAGIDTAKRKFTVLSPSPGKLPTKVAIAGAIEWLEDE